MWTSYVNYNFVILHEHIVVWNTFPARDHVLGMMLSVDKGRLHGLVVLHQSTPFDLRTKAQINLTIQSTAH